LQKKCKSDWERDDNVEDDSDGLENLIFECHLDSLNGNGIEERVNERDNSMSPVPWGSIHSS
jgi:hypothetical protein